MDEFGPSCTPSAAGLRVEGCRVRMNQDTLGVELVLGKGGASGGEGRKVQEPGLREPTRVLDAPPI